MGSGTGNGGREALPGGSARRAEVEQRRPMMSPSPHCNPVTQPRISSPSLLGLWRWNRRLVPRNGLCFMHDLAAAEEEGQSVSRLSGRIALVCLPRDNGKFLRGVLLDLGPEETG